MLIRNTLVVSILALLPSVSQGQDDVIDAARSIEGHVNAGDTASLKDTCSRLEGFQEQGATNAGRYALSFCRYRLATMIANSEDTGGVNVGELLGQAQDDLEFVVGDTEPGSAEHIEALSLQAGVMGFRIGVEPGLAMSLGSRSSRLIAKVDRMAPDNPRAQLQVGVSKFNTPKMFGGSMKKAEQALRKAVSIFADTAGADSPWPNWGYLDALAWLGQTLAEQGKIDEARAAYQQALAINPEMGWVKYELLPQLEKKASTAGP